MKYPWIQFFPGDWLKDPALSLCSPLARGVWIDLLCAMHENNRAGELRGTPEQLSRVARCSPTELTQALTELGATGAANVTECNGVVTVSNRRMKREAKAREQTRKRVTNHRKDGAVTHVKRLSNGDVTADKSEVIYQSTDLESARTVDYAEIPTWNEVKTEADFRGIQEVSAKRFFDHHDGNSLWINQHGRIINWRAKLKSWAEFDRQPKPKTHETNRQPAASRNAGTYNAGPVSAGLKAKVL